MTKVTTMKHKFLGLVLAAGLPAMAAAPAQAAFFFEGLQPFSSQYCAGASNPAPGVAVAPPRAYEKSTPTAAWLHGRPGYLVPRCHVRVEEGWRERWKNRVRRPIPQK